MAASLLCMLFLLVYAFPAAGEPATDSDAALAAKLAAGAYSRRGADTCLGCHDESEPFPTGAVFETVHGHPGVDGSPFAAASPSSYPAGLQCEACHGPIGDHGQRMLREGAEREPIVNFGSLGNASADLQNHFCLACHEDYGRARWASSATPPPAGSWMSPTPRGTRPTCPVSTACRRGIRKRPVALPLRRGTGSTISMIRSPRSERASGLMASHIRRST